MNDGYVIGLLSFALVVAIIALWAIAFRELFRRDMSGTAKALWAVAIVFFPILAAAVYLLSNAAGGAAPTRPSDPRYAGGGPYSF
jgi:hypothetical protein